MALSVFDAYFVQLLQYQTCLLFTFCWISATSGKFSENKFLSWAVSFCVYYISLKKYTFIYIICMFVYIKIFTCIFICILHTFVQISPESSGYLSRIVSEAMSKCFWKDMLPVEPVFLLWSRKLGGDFHRRIASIFWCLKPWSLKSQKWRVQPRMIALRRVLMQS